MAFVCQLCGESFAERGQCSACCVALTPAGMSGDAVDAIAEPPDPPISSKSMIGALAAMLVIAWIYGPSFSGRLFRSETIGLYALGLSLLLLVGFGETWVRRSKKRNADRRLRRRLDERPVTDVGSVEPGIRRLRGKVRMHDPDATLSASGTCQHAFSIVDDTGHVVVETGAVMAAWDLNRARHRIQDGDRVEAIGFVTRNRPRPGDGFRGTKTTLEMHGREGVPLYMRPITEAPGQRGPKIRIEDSSTEVEIEAPAQGQDKARAKRSRRRGGT